MLKNWPLFGQKFSNFGQSIQQHSHVSRAGLRAGNGGNCPRPPAGRGPPWWNLFVSNKILVWKIPRFRSDTSIKGPQQQLISLEIWLSASLSNRCWIAYKYFRFCSIQRYLISLVTCPNTRFWHRYDSLLVHHAYCTNVTKTLLFAC